ncbi:transcriptional regulator [Methylobacterium gnaphalii]|nr:transcriptional regulator [Methylobacterium gnaphalii]
MPGHRAAAALGHPRECLECGETFASTKTDAEFCGDRCRMAFNNRRTKRGAEIYDLFMSLRHDRKTATVLNVFTLVSRLATIYRREDADQRAGRRSWRHASEIIDRRPYLKAKVLQRQPVRQS